MNTFKKIGLGLLLAIFGLIIFNLAPAHKAFAIVTPFNSVNPFAGPYTLQNGVITTNLRTDNGTPLPITFSRNRGTPLVYSSNLQIFCNSQTQANPSIPATITFSTLPATPTVTGTLNVYYYSNGGCNTGDNNKTITINDLDATAGGGIYPPSITDGGPPYVQIEAGHGVYGINKNLTSSCYGGSVLVVNSDGTTAGVYTGLDNNAAETPLFQIVNRTQSPTDTEIVTLLNGCYYSSSGTAVAGTVANGVFTATPPGGGSVTTSPASCYTNYESAFKWIMCPALDLVDSAMGSMNDFVEDQLQFCTGASSTQIGQTCANNMLTNQVQAGWAIFRNIASALLIIVLLIALIGQAVGGGNFIEAYALRKMLPKIVAAVILIQISFVACKWFIDLSNDLGIGVKNLLFAPFGGDANMSLGALVGNGVTATGGPGTFSLFVILAAIPTIIFGLPALLSLGLFAVLALLTAFLVLILRRLLILLLVITAPLALILWILPNTEQYWKKWQSNFTKLLLMFPIIMAMIAGGRIFAYITTSTGTLFTPHIGIAHLGPLPVPYLASVTDFVDLAIVIFAYFGPYFLLPKTFTMGGTIMSSAANAVQKRTESINKRGQEVAKGWEERYRGKRAKAYEPNAGLLSRGYRRLQSGHFLPTERSRRLTIAAGDKWAAERNDEASALVNRTYEKALTNGYNRLKTDANGNYLDAAGNVVNKAHAEVEKLKGVEAGKQALVDITGYEGGDPANRAAQAAHKKLLDTHSEIELQNARIQGGPNEGKRATEVPSWNDTLENSPEHYSAITRSRPDQAPDVKESAEGRVGSTYKEAYAITDVVARQAAVANLDRERLKIALERLTPETLASSHYGFFQDIARTVARTGDASLSIMLKDRLVSFKHSGSPVGANAVGSLHGGKEQYVDAALDDGSGHPVTLQTLP